MIRDLATCHWCHVMERESFEDKQVAQLLNNNFVAIKIDREELPGKRLAAFSIVEAFP